MCCVDYKYWINNVNYHYLDCLGYESNMVFVLVFITLSEVSENLFSFGYL